MRRMALSVSAMLNEQIPVPGFPGFRASRATVYREMIAAGHDQRTAHRFAFGMSVTTASRIGLKALAPWPGREAMIEAYPELTDCL